MNNLSIDECLFALEKKIDALTNLIDQQTQMAPNYFNYNGGLYFQPQHIMPSYYYSGWRTNEYLSYRSQNVQYQKGSSNNNHQQPFDEEQFYALWNEIKKDHAAWEVKMKDQVTNEEAPMTNLENPLGQLAHALEEQYSRTLPSDIKDVEKRECNFMPLSFKEEIQEPTLVEEKNNELANEEEQLVEKRQVEKHHPRTTIENVLVVIDKFNFPIDFVTLGMEKDQQLSSIGTPSNATSQAWIDVEHGEMT